MNACNRLYQLWKHCHESNCRIRTLKKLSSTRWSARYNAVRAVKEIFGQLLATMEWIGFHDPDGAATVSGYSKELQSKSFIVLLILWEEILRKCNIY